MSDKLRLTVPVSAGELIDKITILQIKRERVHDITKQVHIMHELGALMDILASIGVSAALNALMQHLREVNKHLWDIEDEIRKYDRMGNFGPLFVKLAQQVYRYNDRRAAIKLEINQLLGSEHVEVKSYDVHR